MNKMESIINKYDKSLSYEIYKVNLYSSMKYYNAVLAKDNWYIYYTPDRLLPYLMGIFIQFKHRGITDAEWNTLETEVKKLIKKERNRTWER